MMIKIELLVEVNDKHMALIYRGDPRNWPQIVLDEINNMEDRSFNIVMAESSEANEK